MKSFILKSSFLTVMVFILGIIVYSTFLKPYYITTLPVFVILFYLVTNFVHAFLLKISVSSGSRFTSYYMATSFFKMFFYLGVAIVYAYLNRDHAKVFLVNFLFLYAVYATFEVIVFSKVIRQISK